jgi:hypothetical protein
LLNDKIVTNCMSEAPTVGIEWFASGRSWFHTPTGDMLTNIMVLVITITVLISHANLQLLFSQISSVYL